MRARFTLILLIATLGAAAQLPPITVEWSAMRPYVLGPTAHVTRDPLTGAYLWAEYNDFQGAGDEVAYPFLADGTDVSPLFPERFDVGSLDHLIDVQLRDGVIYSMMHHLSLAGSPYYWHLIDSLLAPGLTITNPGSDPSLSELGQSMLVADVAVYGCGRSDVDLMGTAVARIVKADLQLNLAWNSVWDDPGLVSKGFSGMALVGDTVVAMALPKMVLFDDATGNLINVVDASSGLSSVSGDASCIANGSRIYWVLADALGLRVGYHDLGAGADVINEVTNEPMRLGRIALDQFGRIWVTSTATNGTDWTEGDDEGRWHRFDAEISAIDSGTLNTSIDDMCLVNGKISFTGIFDPSLTTAYLITGTPQP